MAKQRSFFKSLRGKISLQMLLVSLIPIVILGSVVFFRMQDSEDNANRSVDRSVDESRTTLENNTVGKTKGRMAWLLSLELETWAAERIAEVKSWAGDMDVRHAAANSSDDGQTAWAMLAEKVSLSQFFEDAYVTNASGDTVVQATGYNAQNAPDNSVWKTAMSKGLCVSEINSDTSTRKSNTLIDIAFRIDDLNTREPIGVVVGRIALNPITLSQEYGSKLPDDRLVIWSRTGQLIVDSENMERFSEQNPAWTEAEQGVLDKMPKDATVVEPNYVITDEVVAGYARAANESVSVQFTEFDGLGWMVMVEEPSETALAALDSLETLKDDLGDDLADNKNMTVIILLGIVLGVVVIVPGVAFYLSRGITRPVAHLRDTAEKVSLGDTEVEVKVESNDEIGDLAESFGRMVAAIRFLSKDGEE